MIEYKTLVLGDLQTNCYLIWDKETKIGVVIDPADDGVYISEEVQNLGLKLKGVLLTHGHFDHILGALDLKLIYNIPIFVNSDDKFLLDRQNETVKFFLKKDIKTPRIEKIDKDLKKIKKIDFGKEKLEIIQSPGHSPGSLCFYSKENKLLFSGDTLFADSRGRTDFKYSSTEEIFKSLKKLVKLPEDTLVLSGHGKETTVGKEKSKYLSN